jgi:chemotaxis protein methyltransferase CheR
MSATGTAPAQLTDAELKLLQSLIYRECGMHFDERRTSFLKDRLQRRLKESQMDSFYRYYRHLGTAEGKEELALLLENLTVNETSFFRNRAQLDLFQKHILEDLLKQKAENKDYSIRIWSAGCSTGQEPYTLAMMVCDSLVYHNLRFPHPQSLMGKSVVPAPWKIEVVASDLNYTVLRSAQEGTYNEAQMSPVEYSCRLRYFDKLGDRYAVRSAIKALVHFDFHNLKTEFVPQQRNDFIFCRNVMMYFDEAEQKRLVEKFYRCLNPGGHVFVGHAESLLSLTEKFSMVHRNSGTAYRRVEERP